MGKSLLSLDVVLRLRLKRITVVQALKLLKVAVWLLLAGNNLSCIAAKPMTVQQLDQMLAAAHTTSDIPMAAQLSDVVRLVRNKLKLVSLPKEGPSTSAGPRLWRGSFKRFERDVCLAA
jgi:hypothetical protein